MGVGSWEGSPGCPGTNSLDLGGLELRDLPASGVLSRNIMCVCVCVCVCVCIHLIVFVHLFFETGFLCVALAVLELTL